MESILTACITGGLALIGVIITNVTSNRRVEQSLKTAQAVTDTKIQELTREVREHNGFAHRIPVLETEVKHLGEEVKKLNSYHKPTMTN